MRTSYVVNIRPKHDAFSHFLKSGKSEKQSMKKDRNMEASGPNFLHLTPVDTD
jgi:hypothetical protein